MILYVFITLITIALAALVRNQQTQLAGSGRALIGSRSVSRQQMLNGVVLGCIFMVLFGVEACRQNVGNDYARYVEFMHLVVSDTYEPVYLPTEIGFNTVVRVLYGISGFENYLLVFAFFALVTIAAFLAAIYEQSDHFLFSFFLFMAFGYYFQSYNTVRYYLAVAIAVYSIPYVLRREWLKFVLLILVGAAFHKSLLTVIPLYFLATLAWKKWSLGLAALFCTTFFYLQDFYLKVVVMLYPTYEDTEYLEGGTSYINIIRCAGVLVFSLLYYKQAVEGNRRNRFYFYCNLGALVLYTCCSFLPIISRIGYYLTVTHIFFLPALIGRITDRKQKLFFTAGIVAAGILYFIMFMMRADGVGLRILPYQTFIFHDMVPIWSDVN